MRMSLPSRSLLVFALAALAGCSSDSATVVQNLTVAATFGAIGASPGVTDLASPVAGDLPGTIRVTGTLALPAPCYDMSARATPSGIFIMVEITAERRTGGCNQVVSAVSYDLTVSGASAGTHTVSVTHVTDNLISSVTQTAAQTNVTVK